jgi:hypothetical protein
MMRFSTIRAIADGLWASAGGRNQFGDPPDIECAMTNALPLAIHRSRDLSTGDVNRLLVNLGCEPLPAEVDRPLRGCVVADVGVGLVIVDSTDSEEEQRLTIAHETAHFVLHYLRPREQAIAALGPKIVPVLDRTRSATRAELFSAALRDVPITPFRHALARASKPMAGRVLMMEMEADELALEILVARDVLRAVVPATASAVAKRFCIPLSAAARLSEHRRVGRHHGGVTQLFGID